MPASSRFARHVFAVLVTSIAAGACTDEPAAGQVALTVSGGAYVEDSIPADAFVDGWTVTFDKFLVAFDYYVQLERQSGYAELSLIEPSVFDLAQSSAGAGHGFGERTLAAGTYDHVQYHVPIVRRIGGGNADRADALEMATGRMSMRIVGAAVRGSERVGFDWGIGVGVEHRWCTLERDLVIDGNTDAIQLTIAGERLFETPPGAGPTTLAFDGFAASDGADGTVPDGVITRGELEAARLWSLVVARAQTLGGVDGRRCDDVTVTPF